MHSKSLIFFWKSIPRMSYLIWRSSPENMFPNLIIFTQNFIAVKTFFRLGLSSWTLPTWNRPLISRFENTRPDQSKSRHLKLKLGQVPVEDCAGYMFHLQIYGGSKVSFKFMVISNISYHFFRNLVSSPQYRCLLLQICPLSSRPQSPPLLPSPSGDFFSHLSSWISLTNLIFIPVVVSHPN